MRYKLKNIFFIALIFFAMKGSAFAHRVVVFAWIDGDTVLTESQFPDGKRVVGGNVTVYDLSGNLLLQGKTNSTGEFSFKIPKPVGMRIVLSAGMGHQGEWTLSDLEVKGSNQASSPSETATPGDKTPSESSKTHTDAPPQVSPAGLSAGLLTEKQIEQIVERVIEKKLKPITQMLVQLQHPGPTLSDIFGGIGYIFGFMGVALYFMSKKKND